MSSLIHDGVISDAVRDMIVSTTGETVQSGRVGEDVLHADSCKQEERVNTSIRNISGLVLVLTMIANFGCAIGPPPADMIPIAELTSQGLRAGDAVQVEIWGELDLSGEFTVNRNGVVVFPLLGDRNVSGIPSDDLEQQLVIDYAEFLENPSVNVTVLRRIAILGEVKMPGLYPVDTTHTLTEMLALAGGLSPTANKHDVQLIRDGVVVRQSLDMFSLVDSTPIQAGDQIKVGERGWLQRNLALFTTGIAALTTIFVSIVVAN